MLELSTTTVVRMAFAAGVVAGEVVSAGVVAAAIPEQAAIMTSPIARTPSKRGKRAMEPVIVGLPCISPHP